MKTIHNKKILYLKTFLFWLFLLPAIYFAQASGTYVSWNKQVGCTNYSQAQEEDPKRDNSILLEEVGNSPCIRVCENTDVTYKVNGNNISNVQWSAVGGTISSIGGLGNSEAVILWGNPGNGAIQVTITYSNGTTENSTLCIEKINGPKPNFAIAGGSSKVCVNTPVYFENLSIPNGGSDIVFYEWHFGDGQTSGLFEPNHTYTQAGSYEVTLFVTNKCNCTRKYSMTVEVIQSPPVQISCVSVVCENDQRYTYTANDTCGGEWKVIGGQLISGNGSNQIQVLWNNIDPLDGFGYVQYRSKCGCPAWTTVKVPVVLKNSKVSGPATICTGKQYKYTLPQWPTTNFQWNITGPGNPQLVHTEQRNEIIVKTDQPGTYTLFATYNNTLLSCGGKGVITIKATSPIGVNGGADEICAKTMQYFSSNPNVAANWQVILGNTVVASSSSPSVNFQYDFPQPGTYIVTATAPGGCTGEGRIIKVTAKPAVPSGTISGEKRVCAGIPYTYTLSTVDVGMIPQWEVTGGTIQGSNTGQNVTVIFNAGTSTYTVSVRNRTLNQLGCLSDPKSYAVLPATVNANIIAINPPASGKYCPSSSASFKVELGDIVPDFMEWSFGDSNFGSFVSGQNTSTINVNLNEIANNVSSTQLKLKVVKCGVEHFFSIPVTLQTLPVLTFNNIVNLCPGAGNILSFNVSATGVSSGGNVVFTFSNGTSYSTPYQSSGNYSFPNNGYVQNSTGANISQNVVVTLNSPNGCSYTPTTNANFLVYPETLITITPGYNYNICNVNSYTPINLYANLSTGITGSTSFQWYQNGGIIPGATQPNLTISNNTPLGTYHVVVNDVNACIAQSQSIYVTNNNCNPQPCIITPNPNLAVTGSWTLCNTLSATATFTGTPTILWIASPGMTVTGGQGTANATFSSQIAGAHNATVVLTYGSCKVQETIEIRKNYQPKFNISQSCNSNGTYTVTLHNSSTVFDINSSAITYTFSGMGLPTQTGQTATYNNLAPGTYTFSLKLSAPGKPDCIVTENYTLHPAPNVNFANPGTQFCKGDIITLTVPNYNSQNIYTWYFNNTSFIASGPVTYITINSSVNDIIVLKAKTPEGCIYTSNDHYINITEANYSGILSSNINICEGSSIPAITFTAGFGFGMPTSFIWMNGDQPVLNASTSATFIPTVSGNYWPVLVGPTGCKNNVMAANPTSVTIRPKPYVNISAKAQICLNDPAILYGIVTDATIEHRWLLNGNPVSGTAGSWTTNASDATYSVTGLAAGSYTFTFEARPVNDPSCGNSKQFTVTVNNPPSAPNISYSVTQCTPYRVQLTASGPSTGIYNWSNGMTGQTITVNNGGAYAVTYTAPSGCTVTSNLQVPHSLERLMWIFPTGCYDVCADGKSYLIGPRGVYDYHAWQLFGNTMQDATNNYILPYWLNQAGSYSLHLEQAGCSYDSGAMILNPNPEKCKTEPCKIDMHIEGVRGDGNPSYLIYGTVHNFGTAAVTITITSASGYGNYSPSSITIPAGSSYDFNSTPLLFYPNSNFPGGGVSDDILLQGNGCLIKIPIEFPGYSNKSQLTVSKSEITISPTPTQSDVSIKYTTGSEKMKARVLTIHDLTGNVKYRKELNAYRGVENLNISTWLQGVYLVNITTDDKSLQGRIIKK